MILIFVAFLMTSPFVFFVKFLQFPAVPSKLSRPVYPFVNDLTCPGQPLAAIELRDPWGDVFCWGCLVVG